MAIKIISVCAGGNHVTVDRDGVVSIELADALLSGGVDTSDGHALREHLKSIGVDSKEKLQAEALKGEIEAK